MYAYEYERVHVKIGYWLREASSYEITENYRAIIDGRGRDGWRYVGFLPAVQLGGGAITEMDLIFEKEISQ